MRDLQDSKIIGQNSLFDSKLMNNADLMPVRESHEHSPEHSTI